MNTYNNSSIKNCIRIFSNTGDKILVVSSSPREKVTNEFDAKIDNYVLGHGELSPNDSESPLFTPKSTSSGRRSGKRYDLIVLDRCLDNQANGDFRASAWASRPAMFAELRELLVEDGLLIFMTANAANLRAPGLLSKALGNIFLPSRFRLNFRSRYKRELRKSGFRELREFWLLPTLLSLRHMVSAQNEASQAFMLRAHGLSSRVPKQLSLWPRWIAVKFNADSWFVSWILVSAKR